jgi:UDP-N-acetylglucosamine 2-epimerase (non-hydrolysing)
MKICVVLGTRPEIIKMSPIIKLLEGMDEEYFVVHTGQHYSYNMDKLFFEDLELPEPRYHLDVGSGSHGVQTGRMLERLEKVLMDDVPDVVLVEGDTKSVLAGALTATKMKLRLGHVEAGLRCFDREMPEEINRVLCDHVSDYLFAPTEVSKRNLLDEGIGEDGIYVVGNTVVDAVIRNMKLSERRGNLIEHYMIDPKSYFLATVHRAENVDDPERLNKIIEVLDRICEKYDADVVYPIHPRASKNLDRFGIDPEKVRLVDPAGYLEFLQLLSRSKLVLTDSGGVQEEACVLGVPCVTLRDSTERPETIDVGSNMLAGVEPENVLTCVDRMLDSDGGWVNPYGRGDTSQRILSILVEDIR